MSTANQTVKKSLFKKTKKRKLSNQVKRDSLSDDEENNAVDSNNNKLVKSDPDSLGNSLQKQTNNSAAIDNENEETSTIEKIQSVKKTRKLKSMMRTQIIKRKNSTRKERKETGDRDDEEELIQKEANKDLKDRLEGTFASTKLGRGGDDDDDDDDGNVLRKKHRLAMEQYIQSQIEDKEGHSHKNTTENDENDHSHDEEEAKVEQNIAVKDKKDLYAQLLESSSAAATATISAFQSNGVQEGDVGAGGAMLGGTGIAEVILSVDDRIKTAKETELAAARMIQARHHRNAYSSIANVSTQKDQNQELSQLLPINFGKGPAKSRKRQLESTLTNQNNNNDTMTSNTTTFSASSAGSNVLSEDVSNLGASYAHNFRLHNHEWISRQKREVIAQSEARKKESDLDDKNDLNKQRLGFDRLGFDAKRGFVGENSNNHVDNQGQRGGRYNQPSKDDRVYRNFMSKAMSKKR
mmetsp:Transcript_26685/g.31053  ORF Transcript_26685/g.31053 Transcript_26685/m.31053 type:complete len:466 (-) Transcript_26685:76-1473(-)